METEKIKQAIKAQKWDKFSYEYAIKHMNAHYMSHGYMGKKADVIERFYNDIQEPKKWNCIKDFTTFKNI
jgi:hypothetical protein